MKDNQLMKKSHLILGGLCLAIGFFLVIIEAIFGKTAKKATEKALEGWDMIDHFIHSTMGYKFIFPLLGLLLIGFLAHMLHPLITKKEERP